MLCLIAAVQGAVIVAQIGAAMLVAPEVLGKIRVVESVYSIALLVACLGLPFVVLHDSAASSNRAVGRDVFVAASGLGTLVAALVFGLALVYVFISSGTEAADVWAWIGMAGVLIPAVILRNSVALLQGWRQAGANAFWLILLSFSLVGLVCLLAWQNGLVGWVVGRGALEAVLAICLVGLIFRTAGWRDIRWREFSKTVLDRNIARRGGGAGLGLLVRVVADSLPLLMFRFLSGDLVQTGLWGLVTLVLFFPSLLMGAFAQYMTPLMVAKKSNLRQFELYKSRLLRTLVVISMFGCLMLAGGALMVRSDLLAEYRGACSAFLVVALALPFRAKALANGVVAMVWQRFRYALLVNVFEVFVIFVAMMCFYRFGAVGVAGAFLISTICVALVAFCFPSDAKCWMRK